MFTFYLAAIPVAIVTVAYSTLAVITRSFDRSGAVYCRLMRQWSHVLCALLRVRVEVSGLEHVDPNLPYVFLANHRSYLDIIAIGVALPQGALFVYKEELTKIPVFGWSLRLSPFIMVRRSDPRQAMQSIEQAALDIRRKGRSVLIFPEGTRSTDGTLGPFKRGGLALATRAGAPIVPVAVSGSGSLMPKGSLSVRPGSVHVTIGEPVHIEEKIDRALERQVQQEVRDEIARMLSEGEG
jgi:1-acyl-sn-glycerol-3-phosphate acyltransferase